MLTKSTSSSRPSSSRTASNTASGSAPPATSVATRRSAACSSASRANSARLSAVAIAIATSSVKLTKPASIPSGRGALEDRADDHHAPEATLDEDRRSDRRAKPDIAALRTDRAGRVGETVEPSWSAGFEHLLCRAACSLASRASWSIKTPTAVPTTAPTTTKPVNATQSAEGWIPRVSYGGVNKKSPAPNPRTAAVTAGHTRRWLQSRRQAAASREERWPARPSIGPAPGHRQSAPGRQSPQPNSPCASATTAAAGRRRVDVAPVRSQGNGNPRSVANPGSAAGGIRCAQWSSHLHTASTRSRPRPHTQAVK